MNVSKRNEFLKDLASDYAWKIQEKFDLMDCYGLSGYEIPNYSRYEVEKLPKESVTEDHIFFKLLFQSEEETQNLIIGLLASKHNIKVVWKVFSYIAYPIVIEGEE